MRYQFWSNYCIPITIKELTIFVQTNTIIYIHLSHLIKSIRCRNRKHLLEIWIEPLYKWQRELTRTSTPFKSCLEVGGFECAYCNIMLVEMAPPSLALYYFFLNKFLEEQWNLLKDKNHNCLWIVYLHVLVHVFDFKGLRWPLKVVIHIIIL